MAQRVNIEVLNKAAVDVTVQNSNAINVEVPTAPRGLSAPFTANKTEIDEGAVVDFTATNPGFQYLFSIEDVGRFVNKIGKNVRHQFLDSGSFDVALTQADLDQQASGIQVKRDFIKVNEVEFLLNKPFATGATAAYSLRKLERSVTKAVRVREDSGNTEADIGFSGGTLDTTALLNHVGSNNGFVTKWYDQTPNLNDASNSTASEQPQIVDNGSVITENGKPGLDFDDADDYLSIGKLQSIAGSNPKSIFGVVSPDSYGDSGGAYIGVNNRTGSGTIWDHCIENGQFALRVAGNAIYDDSEENRTQRLWTTIFDGIDVFDTKIYKDGVNISRTDGSKQIIDTNETGWSIGSSFGQRDKYFDGKIQELILFSSNKSNNRTQIETELNNHYSIF